MHSCYMEVRRAASSKTTSPIFAILRSTVSAVVPDGQGWRDGTIPPTRGRRFDEGLELWALIKGICGAGMVAKNRAHPVDYRGTVVTLTSLPVLIGYM